MYEPTGNMQSCRYCGAGLPQEAAFCSCCGHETGTTAAAQPLPRSQAAAQEEGQYAPVWKRFLARAIDVVAALVAYYSLCFFLGAAWGAMVGEPTDSQIDALVGAALLLVLAGYLIYSWVGTTRGGTLSQQLMGLRVVDKNTLEPPSAGRALARVLMSVFVSTMFYCLGYLWATWDKEKQTWHDKAANTVVVRSLPREAATEALAPTRSMQSV
ncbi:MAG: RDD family protein [Bacillota bacterium]|nr:RDD family protein [Bacillota bacterium]